MWSRFTHRTRTHSTTQAPPAQQSPALQHERTTSQLLPHTLAHQPVCDTARMQRDPARHARAHAANTPTQRAAASQTRHPRRSREPPASLPRGTRMLLILGSYTIGSPAVNMHHTCAPRPAPRLAPPGPAPPGLDLSLGTPWPTPGGHRNMAHLPRLYLRGPVLAPGHSLDARSAGHPSLLPTRTPPALRPRSYPPRPPCS